MVAERLLASGVPSELVTYKTTGDKNLSEPLSGIGAKGLFTKELEDDLARGKVDCCVHSLKDLPTAMPDGLELGALLEREDPRDVLIVNHIVGADTIAQPSTRLARRDVEPSPAGPTSRRARRPRSGGAARQRSDARYERSMKARSTRRFSRRRGCTA